MADDARPENATAGAAAAVAGEGPLACDLEPVVARRSERWRDLLGTERLRLAEEIAGLGEGSDSAATRVWTAVECLAKAGLPTPAPLVLDSSPGDGWQLLRSGRLVVGTLLAPVAGRDQPLVIAVLRPAR